MTCPVAHPAGQLELDLEGIDPLTPEAQGGARLAMYEDRESTAALSDLMLVQDAETREGRVARATRLQQIEIPWASADGWLIPGGTEVLWLHYEARRSYVSGAFVAAILCAHASCERCLAGHLQFADQLDKRLQRAGLGPLAQRALELDLIGPGLYQDLVVVNETRKVIAHFKPPMGPMSVGVRVLAEGGHHDVEDALDAVLQDDAERSLTAAARVIRGLGQLSGPTA